MILELLESRLTPCPASARRLGYAAESVALGARRRRLRRAWAPHIRASRDFVLRAIAGAPRGGRIAVVGSGRLIEIPAAPLLDHFAEVTLIDLVHPWPVRLRAALDRRIRLIEIDVTGVLDGLTRGTIPDPRSSAPDPGHFDVAVSANLLSQLPLLPLDRVPDPDRDRFARELVVAHWNWIRRLAPIAALFTDVESIWIDPGARIEQRDSTLWGVETPPPDTAWTWDLSPAPEEDRRLDHRLTVHGWFDLNKTAPLPSGGDAAATSAGVQSL